MSISNTYFQSYMYNRSNIFQASQAQMDAYNNMINSHACGYDCGDPFHPKYLLDEKIYDTASDIPKIDIKEWAKKQGLTISKDGKTLTCYKTVLKTEAGKLISFYDPSFVYRVGEYVAAKEFDSNQLIECTSGLHACSIENADQFMRFTFGNEKVFLELKVDISDSNNYVIPYGYAGDDYSLSNTVRVIVPSDKFRFRKCFVNRAMKLKLVQKYVNEETGEEFYV